MSWRRISIAAQPAVSRCDERRDGEPIPAPLAIRSTHDGNWRSGDASVTAAGNTASFASNVGTNTSGYYPVELRPVQLGS